MSTAFIDAVEAANLQTLNWDTDSFEMALLTLKADAAGVNGQEANFAAVVAKSPEISTGGYSRQPVNFNLVKTGNRHDIRIPATSFGSLAVGATIQAMCIRRTSDDLACVYLDISGAGFATTGGPVNCNFDNADFSYRIDV